MWLTGRLDMTSAVDVKQLIKNKQIIANCVGFALGGGGGGLFAIQDTFVFYSWQSYERLNRHIGFNVIFVAVFYDVLLVFHDVIILLVYM